MQQRELGIVSILRIFMTFLLFKSPKRSLFSSCLAWPASVLQLHDSHDKLVFVCQGYIDRLSVDKLPPALQQRLKELRASPVPLYDGRLPWSQDVQSERSATFAGSC